MQNQEAIQQKGKRLNKFISDAGICSRREADKMIAQGRVRVIRGQKRMSSGEEPLIGMRIEEGDAVLLDGHLIDRPNPEKMYILLNKPKGIVCTAELKTPDNVISFLGLSGYITYVGRLDKNSTGLLLLTNDGGLNNRMMRAANFHEKEYLCTVDRPVTPAFLEEMRAGVKIRIMNSGGREIETKTRPCTVTGTGDREFSIILTQGLNRQIRRMCSALGYSVMTINRVRIMNLRLGDLPVGKHRNVTDDELKELKNLINHGREEGTTCDDAGQEEN